MSNPQHPASSNSPNGGGLPQAPHAYTRRHKSAKSITSISGKRNSPSPRLQRHDNSSPSHQLQFELHRALEHITLHDAECAAVHAYKRRAHAEQLDAQLVARERADTQALHAARLSRDETRREAEALLARVIKEQEEREEAERRQRQREEEERVRREKEAREQAERERGAREEEDRKAEEERRKRKQEQEERERAEQQRRREETAEKERLEREQAEQERERAEKQRQQDAEAAALQEKKAQDQTKQQQKAAQDQQAATSTVTTDDQRVAETQHQNYLKLYESIKRFKEGYWEELSKDKTARKPVGDARRSIRAEFQKLTAVDTKQNNMTTEKIKQEIMRGLQANTGSMLPVNNFMPAHMQLNDNDSQQIPAVAAYLLAIFAKQAVQICTNSLSDQPKLADAFSLTVVKIFSLPELIFERRNPTNNSSTPITLFSILLAKFHKVAPGLFGITANERTPLGKKKMGWRLERQPEDNPDKNVIVSEHIHFSRMKGVATGYGAIASRNFSKSKTIHPYPPKNLWLSVARIVNMPAEEIQITHILLLRSIFTPEVLKRFILFFGNVAIAVLREVFVELPKRLPQAMKDNFETRDMLQMVSSVFEGEEHLHLEMNLQPRSRLGGFGS